MSNWYHKREREREREREEEEEEEEKTPKECIDRGKIEILMEGKMRSLQKKKKKKKKTKKSKIVFSQLLLIDLTEINTKGDKYKLF